MLRLVSEGRRRGALWPLAERRRSQNDCTDRIIEDFRKRGSESTVVDLAAVATSGQAGQEELVILLGFALHHFSGNVVYHGRPFGSARYILDHVKRIIQTAGIVLGLLALFAATANWEPGRVQVRADWFARIAFVASISLIWYGSRRNVRHR